MDKGGCFLIILLLLAIIAIGPLLAIWSLNTLFDLNIAYSLNTWFAALVLSGIVGGSKTTVKK